jgi:hypothetical protein
LQSTRPAGRVAELESLSEERNPMDNMIWIVAIVCFTVYQIIALRSNPNRYEELKTLNELREKGVITQEEFDDKKADLLS